jgi:hemin uptake protein HemP
MDLPVRTRVRPTTPTQEDVDSLAAFIEAAEELQQEPFFGPDEKLTLGHNGKNYYYNFGDRFHFRSALVSFRRIWLNDEASNFRRISNIICKFEGDESSALLWLPMIREEHERIEKVRISPSNNLKNKELVDLWLNAVFAHNNIVQKRKNPKHLDRIDFERFANELGYAEFEYSFRMAVRQFGLCYRNLLKCVAKPTLFKWSAKYDLNPSFKIGAPFGRGMEETTKDGAKVTRKASTQYWNPETSEQKLNRLLSRYELGQFGQILNRLNVPNLIEVIHRAKSYEEVIRDCGFQIELVDVVDRQKVHKDMTEGKVLALIPCHSSENPDFDSAIYVGKRIVTQQGAITFFEKRFGRLKQLLAE